MSVKNKQNSSVNFLVRAEFLTDRPPDCPPASGDHYTGQCTILRQVRVADRGFRSAGHAGISPLRGRWPRCFFSGKIC